MMLEVKNLKAGYDGTPVVHDVSFQVEQGNIVAILGSNGSGKTTTLKCVTGMVEKMGGSIVYQGQDISKLQTHKMVDCGISMVPEGRHLFGKMNVLDNLTMGAFRVKNKVEIDQKLEEVYSIFPRVKERSSQLAETLSGGEQQMVAIARGLMCSPKLLILDEPSLGLMPILVQEVFEFIQKINQLGVTIVIVEQNASETLAFSDYAYVISQGKTVMEGTGRELLNHEEVKKVYLGLA